MLHSSISQHVQEMSISHKKQNVESVVMDVLLYGSVLGSVPLFVFKKSLNLHKHSYSIHSI